MNETETHGVGSTMFFTRCSECGRKANFFGDGREDLIETMKSSGWKIARSGINHPEIGELVNFLCATCVK